MQTTQVGEPAIAKSHLLIIPPHGFPDRMQNAVNGGTRTRWPSSLLLMLGLVLLLAPWWRNHGYLRDFYDYGLVMAGVGRIDAGERPYQDFVTPIQTGIFLANGWAEQLGDGTYQAMTRGAAVLTAFGLALLTLLLSRRWSFTLGFLLAAAWTAMTLAQHTIIWHNTLAAFALAVAASSAAVAPLWRKDTWPWHVLTAGALLAGGLTKLNAHLVALAAVVAWALQAGLLRKGEWRRVAVTLLLAGFFAIVLPIAIELAWTGASLATWWYNVVNLPFASRSGELAAILDWKFFLAVRHDYYGKLPVPQLGLVGLLATLGFLVTGLRTLGARHAFWVVAAAAMAAASGTAFLATNLDIAYVGMGAWFSLLVALWLGFGLRASGGWFYGSLVAPMLAVGVLAWISAWQGQRSQFGYSLAPRTSYVEAGSLAPDYAYLRGTHLPPGIGESMQATAAWRNTLAPAERELIFYGQGLEWLERVWPVLKLSRMPLWMHGGTSYGPAEEVRFTASIGAEGPYLHLLVPEARDYWDQATQAEFFANYLKRRAGPVWFHYDKLPPGRVSWRPIDYLSVFGGNINSTRIVSSLVKQTLGDRRSFLGLSRGRGDLQILDPSFRAQGVAVLKKVEGKEVPPDAKVRFEAFAVSGQDKYRRWSEEWSLAPDQAELLAPFPLDCSGLPMLLTVTIPPELDGKVVAGFRDLKLTDTVDGPETPMKILPDAAEAVEAGQTERAALIAPAVGWEPPAVYIRNGRAGANGLELLPGGELWIKLSGRFSEIDCVATAPADAALPSEPVIRVLYYKQAKLEIQTQSVVASPSRTFAFKAWSSEANGWLVVLVDPIASAPPVALRVTGVRKSE